MSHTRAASPEQAPSAETFFSGPNASSTGFDRVPKLMSPEVWLYLQMYLILCRIWEDINLLFPGLTYAIIYIFVS